MTSATIAPHIMRSEQRQLQAMQCRIDELEHLLHLRENVITQLSDRLYAREQHIISTTEAMRLLGIRDAA